MIKDKETLIQLTIFPCLSDRLRSSVLDDLRTDRETAGQEENDALSQLLDLLNGPTDRPEWETYAMQSLRRHYLESAPWTEVLAALQGFRVRDGSTVIRAVCAAVRPWFERRDSLLERWQEKPPQWAVLFLFVCVFGQNRDTGKCFRCPLFGSYVRIPSFPDIQMCTIYDSSKRICLLLLFVFARFCMVLFWMLSSHVRKDLSFLIMPGSHTEKVSIC